MSLRNLLRSLRSATGRERLAPTADSRIARLAFLIASGEVHGIEYLDLCLQLGLRARAIAAASANDATKNVPLGLRFRLALLDGADAAGSLLDDVGSAQKGEVDDILALATSVMPQQALAWMKVHAPSHPARAALELSTGHRQVAANRLAPRKLFRDPDEWLLKANLADSTSEKVTFLNRYLTHFNLDHVRLRDTGQAMSIMNISPVRQSPPRPPEHALLSVIMTTYNSAQYLSTSIGSIERQNHSNMELIVVDDGSTDDTLVVLKSLKHLKMPLQLIPLTKNVGTYAAKNIGLQLASGELATFHDADDWSHPERFSRLIQALNRNTSAVGVTCSYIRLENSGIFFSAKTWPLTRWTPNSLLFRRELVLDTIGYTQNTRFGADSEYVARLRLAFGEQAYRKIDVPLIIAAHHPASLTNSQATGVQILGASPRAKYQEHWTEDLLLALHEKRSLYQPPQRKAVMR